ncbi:MAG: DUF1127 domain-containing protein [Pseudomonadota bacterium]
MTNTSIWTISNPAYNAMLRRASEERAAAVYRALGPIRRVSAAIGETLATGLTRLHHWFERTQTLQILNGLSDHSLRDIGLTREDLATLETGDLPSHAKAAISHVARPERKSDYKPLAFTLRDTLEPKEQEEPLRRAA